MVSDQLGHEDLNEFWTLTDSYNINRKISVIIVSHSIYTIDEAFAGQFSVKRGHGFEEFRDEHEVAQYLIRRISEHIAELKHSYPNIPNHLKVE